MDLHPYDTVRHDITRHNITNNVIEERLETQSNTYEQHDGTSMNNVKKHQLATQ
jgi:hypothetical protein